MGPMGPTAFLPPPQFRVSTSFRGATAGKLRAAFRRRMCSAYVQETLRKGPARSVMPEHCPSPQSDGLCLLRGGNMRNGEMKTSASLLS